MSLLAYTDFTGEWDLSLVSYNQSDLTLLIASVEEKYLRDLLGDDLYKAFQAAIEGTPATKWKSLRDGIDYKIEDSSYDNDDDSDIVYKYFPGVKTMLKYLTWFEYVRRFMSFNYATGEIYPGVENGVKVTPHELHAKLRFYNNKGIEIYKKAYEFIYEMNDTTEITSISGTTVNTERTKFLVNGDTVEISGTQYTISSVVTDTSFVTDSQATASSWQKYFYPNWKYKDKQYMSF